MTQDTSGISQTIKSNSHNFENTKNPKGELNGKDDASRETRNIKSNRRITLKISKRNDGQRDSFKDQENRSSNGKGLNEVSNKTSSKERPYDKQGKTRGTSNQGLHHHTQAITQYLTVKEIARMFSVSEYSIYQGIKEDPTFPFIDVGPKKNYRIDVYAFMDWLKTRTQRRKKTIHRIISAEELLNGI